MITTTEFEQELNNLLTKMEDWPRCEWCGCDGRQRRTASNSNLCDSCKEWKRSEQRARQWIEEHPDLADTERYMRVEYNIEYAALCREEGKICSWKGPIMPLNLEWELKSISERFCGEDIFGHSLYYFEHFSEAQRRLLMFIFEELTKVWIRHHRRSFAIDKVMNKHFSRG